MANQAVRVSLVVLFVFSLLEIGSCLKCYNCSSVLNTHCKDQFNKEKPEVPALDCAPSEVCIKHEMPSIDLNPDDKHKTKLPAKFIRGCKPKNYCDDLKTVFKTHCLSCTENLCNSSAITMPSFVVVAFAVIKYFINY